MRDLVKRAVLECENLVRFTQIKVLLNGWLAGWIDGSLITLFMVLQIVQQVSEAVPVSVVVDAGVCSGRVLGGIDVLAVRVRSIITNLCRSACSCILQQLLCDVQSLCA